MRKRWLGTLLCLLLLGGCSRSLVDEAEQMALDARARYLAAPGLTATWDITADYGERVFSCRLAVEHTAGEETSLRVLEPELLQGVTARLQDGESLLEFDGVVLDTGSISPEGQSPLDCVPFFLKELQSGYLSQWELGTLEETPCLHLVTTDPSLPEGEGTRCELWLAQEDSALLRAELAVEENTVLQCVVQEFQWKESGDHSRGQDTNEDLGGG